MNTARLNEHNANQGAQSKGEFLGMTGNSAWYLLGAAGASIALVIVLWGILGLSLLVCLALGLVLCALSLAYVFVLKNNRPEHYDTDFFASALIEAGVTRLEFGPRDRRAKNPFRSEAGAARAPERSVAPARARAQRAGERTASPAVPAEKPEPAAPPEKGAKPKEDDATKTVPLSRYEKLEAKLEAAEELLADAAAAQDEEDVCD